jgi:hypothetical protein
MAPSLDGVGWMLPSGSRRELTRAAAALSAEALRLRLARSRIDALLVRIEARLELVRAALPAAKLDL